MDIIKKYLKKILNKFELLLWSKIPIKLTGISFNPIGGGGSSKSSKAQQSAAESVANAQRQAAEEANRAALKTQKQLVQAGQTARSQMLGAGQTARSQMLEAGKPTTEETALQERYKTKTGVPAEQLLTGTGEIGQAVAKRIAERVNQPGLDYTTQSSAFTEGVTNPLWRALKARGIVPPAGAEGGGGLATQQYMKGAEPALAELRANQINTDITRGQTYNQTALETQKYYETLLNELAQALGGRGYQAGIAGAQAEKEAGIAGAQAEQAGGQQGYPYTYTGAAAKGQGLVSAEQTNQAEVNARYAAKEQQKTELGKALAMVALGAISGGATATMLPASWGATVGAGALAGGAAGGASALGGSSKASGGLDLATVLALNKLNTTQPTTTTTPYERQLNTRSARYGKEMI